MSHYSKVVHVWTGPVSEPTPPVLPVSQQPCPASSLAPGDRGIECLADGTFPDMQTGTDVLIATAEAIKISGGFFKKQLLQNLQEPRNAGPLSTLLVILPWYQKVKTAGQQAASAADRNGTSASTSAALPDAPPSIGPSASTHPNAPPSINLSASSSAPSSPTRSAIAAAEKAATAAAKAGRSLLATCSFDFICSAAQEQARSQPGGTVTVKGSALEGILLGCIEEVLTLFPLDTNEDKGDPIDAVSTYKEWGLPIEDLRHCRNIHGGHPWESQVELGDRGRLFAIYKAAVGCGSVALATGVPCMARQSVVMVRQWLEERKAVTRHEVALVGPLDLSER